MLKQRVVTALVLIAILIPILFFLPRIYAKWTFVLIATLGAWEWGRMTSSSAAVRRWFPRWIFACCVLCLSFPFLQMPLCRVAAVFWLLVPVWLIGRWPLAHPWLGYLVGTMVLVPTWAAMTVLHGFGPKILLVAMALVWVADIAAYFVGRAFGRHKLAPEISPGKTWEGAIGALLGGIAYAYLLSHFGVLGFLRFGQPVIIGFVVLVVFSIIGDLFESMIKRQAGVKDSSQLLPGHGGILDRIDSLTSTLPILVAAIGFWKP
jgi:phosphatidate cytidylyltransferase